MFALCETLLFFYIISPSLYWLQRCKPQRCAAKGNEGWFIEQFIRKQHQSISYRKLVTSVISLFVMSVWTRTPACVASGMERHRTQPERKWAFMLVTYKKLFCLARPPRDGRSFIRLFPLAQPSKASATRNIKHGAKPCPFGGLKREK